MTLYACGLVGSRGRAFEVSDDGAWLVKDLAPRGAHGECQIHVLVICRRKSLIESTELSEQLRRNRKTGSRTVVHLAHIVVFRLVRVIVPAVVPGRAIAPDNAAGFLQPAIRIDELGTDEPCVRMTLEDRQHRVEPARSRDGIVVKEDQDLATRIAGGAIAAADKTDVGIVAQETHAADDGKCRLRRFRRGVVENPDLLSPRW